MWRRRLALSALLAALVWSAVMVVPSSPTFAGRGKSFLGQEAPEIQASEWINLPARTSVADYRGEVLLLEFFATWCGPCRPSITHLIRIIEKYGNRGFHVLSLSNEPRVQVERYIHLMERRMTYPIAIKAPNPYAVTGIPHAYLIDVDGKVVWEGSPMSLTDDLVEKQILRIRKWRDVEGRRAARAGKLLDKGELAKAWAAAAKVLDSDRASEADKRSAREISGHVQAEAERRLAWSEALVGDGRPDRAQAVLEAIAVSFKGTKWNEKADLRVAELERDVSVKEVVTALKHVTRILGTLKTPVGEKKREAVHRALKEEATKHEGDAKAAIEHWVEIFREKWVPKR